MNREKAVVIFYAPLRRIRVDLEIPLNISASDLVYGLDEAYHLGIRVKDVKDHYLKAENPVALLKGNRLLSEYGLHNGSVILFNE